MSVSAATSVRIDQVFHGYDRGHKELASSVVLDEDSRATMLVNSDLLADLDDGSAGSYLTCYPLPRASRHILARTWLAGAGYRPGSVWTHSLVLDYQALALLADLVALEHLLMSSGEIERGKPAKSLFVSADINLDTPCKIGPNAAVAIEGLYSRYQANVVVPAGNRSENDLLALALWRQMWPKLRREFSFISGVSTSRSVAGSDWMLQFSRKGSYGVEIDIGLQALLVDLPIPGQTPLRLFLSRYAVESSNPRRIARPLAKLWSTPALRFEDRLRAVRELTDDFPLRRLIRDVVARELDEASGPVILLELVTEFGDQPIDIDASRVVRLTNAMDADSFRSLLTLAAAAPADCLGGHVFEAAVRGSDLHHLADAAEGADRAAMLRLRPELVDFVDFWPQGDAERADLINVYDGDFDLERGWALFGKSMGPLTGGSLLERTSDPPAPILVRLLAEGSTQVATLVASRVIVNRSLAENALETEDAQVIEHLASAQIESAEPPSSPASWCAAICRVGGQSAAPATLVTCYVAGGMMPGSEGLEAARQAYDPLQRLVGHFRLTRDQERYLEASFMSSSRGRSLTRRTTQSALTRWPPDGAAAGALTLSNEFDHFRHLVDEALDRLGRWRLREALSDTALPSAVRSYIERKLDESTKKSWWS